MGSYPDITERHSPAFALFLIHSTDKSVSRSE
jgi:hypothetical protein